MCNSAQTLLKHLSNTSSFIACVSYFLCYTPWQPQIYRVSLYLPTVGTAAGTAVGNIAGTAAETIAMTAPGTVARTVAGTAARTATENLARTAVGVGTNREIETEIEVNSVNS